MQQRQASDEAAADGEMALQPAGDDATEAPAEEAPAEDARIAPVEAPAEEAPAS